MWSTSQAGGWPAGQLWPGAEAGAGGRPIDEAGESGDLPAGERSANNGIVQEGHMGCEARDAVNVVGREVVGYVEFAGSVVGFMSQVVNADVAGCSCRRRFRCPCTCEKANLIRMELTES